MWSNHNRLLAAIVTIIALLLTGACSRRPTQSAVPSEQRAAAEKALAWLQGQQNEDGSFDAGFGHPAGLTCDAALAVVAAGGEPTATGKPSLTDYLAGGAHEYAVDAATTGKLIITLVAANQNPTAFAGKDWLAHLRSFSDGGGAYDPGSVGQAWAILALKAARQSIPSASVDVLKSYQLDSGAWASAFGPDNDTVAYALQALSAAGESVDSLPVQRALAFFRLQQNEDGGFPAIKPSEWGTESNANSTANVIMALLAVGQDPAGEEWVKSGGSPMSALLGLQADDGRIEFQLGIGEPLLSTVQAIPALMNRTLLGVVGK